MTKITKKSVNRNGVIYDRTTYHIAQFERMDGKPMTKKDKKVVAKMKKSLARAMTRAMRS